MPALVAGPRARRKREEQVPFWQRVALDAATGFAMTASLFVAALTAYMAYRVLRSYRLTGDLRLLFVFLAFLVFSLKSVFIAITVVPPHIVEHDSIEAVGALFDAIIVALLFVPFIARAPE